jgi:hypothetical protein
MEKKIYGGTASHMTSSEEHNGLYYLVGEQIPRFWDWD